MQQILIAEDHPEITYFLEFLLKRNGYGVLTAANGAEALALARENPPDLVISDILMPVMDGYVLCREWRADERLKTIPFIFYTATFTEKKDEDLALSLGADLFVVKPQEPEVLMAIIRDLLAKGTVAAPPDATHDETIMKEYSEALFRKLEKKMADLEAANRELSERIEREKKLEEQLRHALKMEAVGRFSAGIAHDFNNILTVIIGNGGMLRMKGALNEAQCDKIDRILEAADRAKNLTGSILAFSRKQPRALLMIDLRDVVSGVETFLRQVMGEDVAVALMGSPDSLPVMGDRGQIEQMLLNLAVNARDAMAHGGTFSVQTAICRIDEEFIKMHSFGVSGEYAAITVSDTGIGMDGETRQHIFEPFFSTKDQGKGTGLGLAIVYGIVQQHNGYIQVYSEPGLGTTFKVLLPLAHADGVSAPGVAARQLAVGGSETILVADNEEPIREYLSSYLSTLGYRVFLAGDGAEALDLYLQHRDEIDLLLMDVIMPEKTGIEAAEEIWRDNGSQKILFMSGYPLDAIEQHLLPRHAELAFKPLAPTELAIKVREMLDR